MLHRYSRTPSKAGPGWIAFQSVQEDRLQEDAGPLVSFPEFQQGQGSLAQFLLRRASTAAWSSAGVSRSLRLSFKCAGV